MILYLSHLMLSPSLSTPQTWMLMGCGGGMYQYIGVGRGGGGGWGSLSPPNIFLEGAEPPNILGLILADI